MPFKPIASKAARDRGPTGRGAACCLAGAAWLAGAAGALLTSPAAPDVGLHPDGFQDSPYRDLRLFGAAFHAIRSRAADMRGDGPLIDAAIVGMLAALDRHSHYLTAAEFRRLDEQDTGSYAGIGVVVDADGTVRRTLPDAPAARAGLTPGTIIQEIDGVAIGRIAPDQVADRLRGEPDSTVRVRVVRPGEPAPAEMVLIREWLPLHPVRLKALDTVAYLGLDHFDEFTTGRLLRAVANLKAGIGRDRLTGFILDLRGNPGGLVVQAVAVAGAFLGRGEIVRLVGRDPGSVERFALDRTGADVIDGLPLVVLVDGGTASAAEIVAGALQDHRRAILIGTRTYGKGAVQTTYAHRDGRALRLTTAWFVTPAGRRVDGNGIAPDRVVTPDGMAAGTQGRLSPEPGAGGGSLQDGFVADGLIDPSRDRPLTAAVQHLLAVSQSGGGLIHRNDPSPNR
ncbi:S41 family peptidase [Methylobacterium sp. 1973]|uniref:S41 family peptidase n=1 Tax=Methylobacterium sp. 1973 TaxID=3156421 RepID=UPI0033971DEA